MLHDLSDYRCCCTSATGRSRRVATAAPTKTSARIWRSAAPFRHHAITPCSAALRRALRGATAAAWPRVCAACSGAWRPSRIQPVWKKLPRAVPLPISSRDVRRCATAPQAQHPLPRQGRRARVVIRTSRHRLFECPWQYVANSALRDPLAVGGRRPDSSDAPLRGAITRVPAPAASGMMVRSAAFLFVETSYLPRICDISPRVNGLKVRALCSVRVCYAIRVFGTALGTFVLSRRSLFI